MTILYTIDVYMQGVFYHIPKNNSSPKNQPGRMVANIGENYIIDVVGEISIKREKLWIIKQKKNSFPK